MADGSKRMTWEDIMHLPEHLGAEIFGGKIYYKAMPRRRHGLTHRRLGAVLDPATRSGVRDGWHIANETDICLSPSDYARPDMAGWRLSRLTEDTDEWPTALLPDWVCEVLSPTNASYDRGTKMAAYAQAGIPWAGLAHCRLARACVDYLHWRANVGMRQCGTACRLDDSGRLAKPTAAI